MSDINDRDEDIIELTDIVDEKSVPADDGLTELTDIIEETGTELGTDITMEDSIDDDKDSVEPQNLNLTQDQLEASLERIIEKKFGDKIETILFEITEKVINEQVIKIKKSLQKDLDQI